MLKYLKDYTTDECYWNGKFAIECEVTEDQANKVVDALEETFDERFYPCSEKIVESFDVHLLEDEKRKIFLDTIVEITKDSMPVGEDGYLSGGNHFHIFFPKEALPEVCELICLSEDGYITLINQNKLPESFKMEKKTKEKTNNYMAPQYIGSARIIEDPRESRHSSSKHDFMWDLITKIPLYAKPIGNGKWVNRRNHMAGRRNIGYVESKSTGITLKVWPNDWFSLEFRVNNVIDPRLYAYYSSLMILASEKDKYGSHFRSLGNEDNRKATLLLEGHTRNWNLDENWNHDYDAEENLFEIPLTDSSIHMEGPRESELSYNLKMLVKLNLEWGRINCAHMLYEYIDENSILPKIHTDEIKSYITAYSKTKST